MYIIFQTVYGFNLLWQYFQCALLLTVESQWQEISSVIHVPAVDKPYYCNWVVFKNF